MRLSVFGTIAIRQQAPRAARGTKLRTDQEHEPPAQQTALHAIADVIEGRLRQMEKVHAESGSGNDRYGGPLIVQLDGRGHSQMLDALGSRLGVRRGEGSRWTVVRFDAWQYQRLAPPWWWIVDALDRQIRCDSRPPAGWRSRARWRSLPGFSWSRVRDWLWRLAQLTKDLRIAVFVIVAVVVWLTAGSSMDSVLKAAAGIATAAGTLALAVTSGLRPLRRRLLQTAPLTNGPLLHGGDPMSDLRRRYTFLLKSAGTPVLVLIDELDRCRADYVVDLLEGLQTLLRHPQAADDGLPYVSFVVAADRAWLCQSFLQRYKDFEYTARQPGRPFGQGFLEKVFDLELRLPLIPAKLTLDLDFDDAQRGVDSAALATARDELAIRRHVCAAEAEAAGRRCDSPPPPLQSVRIAAVRQLGQLELEIGASVCPASSQFQCLDTVRILADLVGCLDAGASMIGKLDAA
jgi:hypothetical protein